MAMGQILTLTLSYLDCVHVLPLFCLDNKGKAVKWGK